MGPLTQRRFSNRTMFEFAEDRLRYTIRHPGGSRSFSVPYAAIQTDSGRDLEEAGAWLRNTGILGLLIGAMQAAELFIETGTVRFSIWFAAGVTCLAFYAAARTRYTVFGSESGDILIIRDNRHDRIVSEIREKRKKQLLALYGQINYDNDPNEEVNKFLWLKQQDLITQEEVDAVIEKLSAFHQDRSGNGTEKDDKEKIIN